VSIGDTLQESADCVTLADRYESIYATVGVHPHCAKDWDENSATTLEQLKNSSGKVRAIGEIGLDYHYDNSPRDVQREVFSTQLLLAVGWGMPVVVHCRDAVDDVRTIVEDVGPEKLVLHCCCEKWEDVAWFVERGYLLSFTGIATYPKADDIRDTIKNCPLEQMMVETDAPYLPPEAQRAKGGRNTRNEPAYVVEVAKLIAELKGVSLEKIDSQTTKNTERFYGF
jgi:TatD DNase family protein